MKTDLINHSGLKIAVLQRNFTVGDAWGNARILAEGYTQALAAGATLVVAPELAMSGYPPQDNLLHDAFLRECAEAADWLASQVGSVPLAFGMPCMAKRPGDYGQKAYNSYVVAQSGQLVFQTNKVYPAQGGVFDEYRVHKPGKPQLWSYMGLNIGFPICEDIWHQKVVRKLVKMGAQLLIAPNGSPDYAGKPLVRHNIVRNHVRKWGVPMLYINHVGGQDEHAFSGGAFFVNPASLEPMVFAPYWEEAMALVEVRTEITGLRFALPAGAKTYPLANPIRFMLDGILLTMRDYVYKSSSIRKVVVAVSGGVDSAVVLAMAVMAFGKENVIAISLPSMHNTEVTKGFAEQICLNLGIKLHWWSIGASIEALKEEYGKVFGHPLKETRNTAYENTQSRERGQIVMAIANREHALLLSTGNKSEMGMGYATLYGDMNGGFNPLKTLYKTQVYQIGFAINQKLGFEAIPVALITQRPSAELDDDQFDENSLPAYPVLDAVLARFMDDRLDPADIIRKGLPNLPRYYGNTATCTFTIVNMQSDKPPLQQWQHVANDNGKEEAYIVSAHCVVAVILRLLANRFKRYQACPGVTITGSSFDSGEKYPIANHFKWVSNGVEKAMAKLPVYLPKAA